MMWSEDAPHKHLPHRITPCIASWIKMALGVGLRPGSGLVWSGLEVYAEYLIDQ